MGLYRSRVAERQPASGKGSNGVRDVCRFTLDRLLPPRKPHAGGQRPWEEWSGREGVLHPHRQGKSNLLTMRPQTTPGSHSHQRSSVVWGVAGLDHPRAEKRKKEERIPPKGKRGKSLTLLEQWVWWVPPRTSLRSSFSWRMSVSQGILESVHGEEVSRNCWRTWGKVPGWAEGPCESHQMWGRANWVEAGGTGAERIHPSQNKEIKIYQVHCKGAAGWLAKEKLPGGSRGGYWWGGCGISSFGICAWL